MGDFVTMRNITKQYGNGTLANDRACFSLREGEIHAVAGENGAGKSTLMKILFGAEQADSGEILINDKPVSITSPRVATRLGIGMVYQHFMLVDELTVFENVFLGVEKKRGMGFLDKKAMQAETRLLSEKYDMPLDPCALCGSLPVGLRQKVEILKVLARGAKVIILDEPTAVLTPQESEQLFRQLRLLREQKHTIVIITHKIKEIKALCDRITVLRGGKTMGVYRVDEVSEQEISDLMVGSAVRLLADKPPARPGDIAVCLKGVTVGGRGGKPALNNVSFMAHRGEILCLAGIEGNGQQQVVDCLTGLNDRYQGTVQVLKREVRERSIRKVRLEGLAHIPADRMTMGTNQRANLYANLIAVDFARHCRFGFLRQRMLKERSRQELTRFLVKGDLMQPISMLSGGNMQKVVIARELSREPQVVIANQPTRGVDVGAVAFIHERLVAMREAGCCIVLVSADLGEVFALADRILVFHDGKITAELTDVKDVSEQRLGRYMLGIDTMEAAQ